MMVAVAVFAVVPPTWLIVAAAVAPAADPLQEASVPIENLLVSQLTMLAVKAAAPEALLTLTTLVPPVPLARDAL